MLYYTFAEKAEVADPESISGINKPQIEEMLKNGDMKGDLVSDWLQTYNSDRPNKKASFLRFSEWLDKTPNEILNLRRQDTNRTFEKLCIKCSKSSQLRIFDTKGTNDYSGLKQNF